MLKTLIIDDNICQNTNEFSNQFQGVNGKIHNFSRHTAKEIFIEKYVRPLYGKKQKCSDAKMHKLCSFLFWKKLWTLLPERL